MKILLTGAAGYVGSALHHKLLDAGHEVTGIDTEWFGRSECDVEKFDVRKLDQSRLDNLGGFEAIIHLAAISNDPSVSHYPRLSWETGVLATQQLAQMASKTGCRFIYASSVSVYGADRGQVVEDMDLHPLSDYNKTKMCAERVLLSYPEIRPQIIRPATICGLSPRMRLDLTVNLFTMQALMNGVITVHGGQQYRPSIHIDDMTDLYLFMLDHPELTGIYNAGFENHQLIEIARTIGHMTGAKVVVTEQKDTRSYRVNSDKLLATGFKPKKNIRIAIAELVIAWEAGTLQDLPQWTNLTWMQHLGIKDE
jgi:nucleoside-diphosphate-sugar epimerase